MKNFLVIFLMLVTFFSCKNEQNNELVFNIYSAPKSIAPNKSSDTISLQVASTIYEGLLRLDDKNEIVGGLASSYTKEGNKYIFDIRKGLKYSDGSNIELVDIRNAFLETLNKEYLSQYSNMLFVIKNAKEYYEGKVDEKELGVYIEDGKLIIELKEDVPYFTYLMTLPFTSPNIKGKYTGAFYIENLGDQEIKLVKNTNYWRSNEVKLEKFKYVYFSDFSTINNLIKNGSIDISRVDSELLDGNINSYYNGRVWYLDFNVFGDNVLNNVHLRNALSLSIDRQKYVDKIKKDGSKKALNLISDIFNYEPSYTISDIDVNKAKSELDIAKKELNTNDIKLEILAGNTPVEVKEVQYIQSQIKENLGLEFSVKVVPYKDRLANIKELKYDIALNTWSPKYDNPISILDRFTYKKKDVTVFNQKEFQNLLNEANKDILNSNAKIQQAEKLVLENMVVSPLYFSIENQYISKRVKNVVNHPIGNITDMSYINFE